MICLNKRNLFSISFKMLLVILFHINIFSRWSAANNCFCSNNQPNDPNVTFTIILSSFLIIFFYNYYLHLTQINSLAITKQLCIDTETDMLKNTMAIQFFQLVRIIDNIILFINILNYNYNFISLLNIFHHADIQ